METEPPDSGLNRRLRQHLEQLSKCNRCPAMHKPVVTGLPVVSPVMLVGQAPGIREPEHNKLFVWTAGTTLFRWMEQALKVNEESFRHRVFLAAVCRCFPGKPAKGPGDRLPNRTEIMNCSSWLQWEFQNLRPELVIALGKLAITRFIKCDKLENVVGRTHPAEYAGIAFDVIPLPHPSGASRWPQTEPGKSLLREALRQISRHPAAARVVHPRTSG